MVLRHRITALAWTTGVAISSPCTRSTSSAASSGSNSTAGSWALTTTTLDPRLLNCRNTAWRAPSPMPIRLTTEATPMATPRTVRPERRGLARMP